MASRKLIAVVGATASGKTALALELARRFDGEIVGADSRQVCRGMDVGTAKPTPYEQVAARHHLIDVVEPDEPFSLGQWVAQAREALEDIWSRGKLPLVVGGTGQYVWALLEGWRVPRVEPNAALRKELTGSPPEDLLRELREVDAEAEAFIDPRNVRRVVRALEVYRATGKPFSYWRTKEPPAFEWTVIGVKVARAELYRRIDVRVDAMVNAGFVEEVHGLLERGCSRELPSMSGIGYREMCEHLAGEISLETAVERTKAGTHRLARYQHTWFKAGDARIHWVSEHDEAMAVASEFLQQASRV